MSLEDYSTTIFFTPTATSLHSRLRGFHFHIIEVAEQVLKTKSAHRCKDLARQIICRPNLSAWLQQREFFLGEGLKYKFTQNHKRAKKLLETRGFDIAMATLFDY